MPTTNPEPKTDTLAETENYLAWKAEEPDGETTYHLEINNVTLHFFQEEWEEFLKYAREFETAQPDEDGFYSIEFYNVGVWLDKEDWSEFKQLIGFLQKGGS